MWKIAMFPLGKFTLQNSTHVIYIWSSLRPRITRMKETDARFHELMWISTEFEKQEVRSFQQSFFFSWQSCAFFERGGEGEVTRHVFMPVSISTLVYETRVLLEKSTFSVVWREMRHQTFRLINENLINWISKMISPPPPVTEQSRIQWHYGLHWAN